MPIITLLLTLAVVGIVALVENSEPKKPAMTKEEIEKHMIDSRK